MAITPHVAVDEFRMLVLKDLVASWSSFTDAMQTWRGAIHGYMPLPHTGNRAFAFGEDLYDVFRSNPGKGTRAAGSEAGYAFQGLLVWYLNMLLFGTDVIVSHNKGDLIPASLTQATAVSISNNPSNSEADLFAYSVPGGSTKAMGAFGTNIAVEGAISGNLAETSVSILQLKTTWNENAQLPMLWDVIYREAAAGRTSPNFKIGSKGNTPAAFRNFSYGFATVPGHRQINYPPTSLPARRVQNLSGGNYWLRPRKANVAENVNEFPGTNFAGHIASTPSGSLSGHIQANLDRQPTLISDFVDLQFS